MSTKSRYQNECVDDSEPKVKTGSFCLDYACIDDKRCIILTGITKDNFFELYKLISSAKLSGNVILIIALGFYQRAISF